MTKVKINIGFWMRKLRIIFFFFSAEVLDVYDVQTYIDTQKKDKTGITDRQTEK